MKTINTLDYAVDVTGVGYGLANIQTILGIIVLVLTIFNILLKAGIKIYDHIKKREIEEITQVIDDTIEEIKEVENGKSK